MHYFLGPLDLRSDQRVVFDGTEIVPLAPKTFDLLLVLVENAGEVVSRETLRDQIWPSGFVEEAVISRSVSLLRSKLRPYLGEAEFIETVPKRGYRYIGEVRTVDAAAPADEALPMAASEESTPTGLEAEQGSGPSLSETPIRGVSVRTQWASAAVAVGLILLIPVVAVLRMRAVRAGGPVRASIAVMEPQDLSGSDSTGWVGVVLQEGLQAELSGGQGLAVSPSDQTTAVERELGSRGARQLSAADLRNVSRRLGTRLVLTASYLVLNGEVRLDLVVREVATGKYIDQWSDTLPQTQLNQAVQQAGAHLRSVLKLKALDKPVSLPFRTAAEVGNHYYAEGMSLERTGDYSAQAADALSKAIRANRGFARAHAELSVVFTRLGEGKAAEDEANLALATSAELPESERLVCQASSYSQLADVAKAVSALRRLHQLAPSNAEYTVRLAEQLARDGQLTEAQMVLNPLAAPGNPQANDAEVLLALAELSERRGDLKSVLLYAGQLLRKAEADGSRFEQAQSLRVSGGAWSELGDFERALKDLKKSEDLFTAIGDREGAIQSLLAQATAMQHHDDPEAVATTNRALQAARETDEKPLIARGLLYLGNIQLTHAQEIAAEGTYKQAITLSEAIHESDVQLSALSTLGTAEFAESQTDDAIQHTEEALALARAEGALSMIARSTGQLGELDRGRADFAAAERHMRESADAWKQLGQMMRCNDALFELGEVLLRQGKLQETRAVFQSIDDQTMSAGDASLLKTEEARLTAAEGDLKLAETMAANSARTANSADYSVVALELLADLQLRQHDLVDARKTVDDMSAKIKSIPGDDGDMPEVTLLQARLASESGDYSGAQERLRVVLQAASKARDKELMDRAQIAEGEMEQRAGSGNASLLTAVKSARQDGFVLMAESAALPRR